MEVIGVLGGGHSAISRYSKVDPTRGAKYGGITTFRETT